MENKKIDKMLCSIICHITAYCSRKKSMVEAVKSDISTFKQSLERLLSSEDVLQKYQFLVPEFLTPEDIAQEIISKINFLRQASKSKSFTALINSNNNRYMELFPYHHSSSSAESEVDNINSPTSSQDNRLSLHPASDLFCEDLKPPKRMKLRNVSPVSSVDFDEYVKRE